ncbi:MAG: site-specific integrase [Gammaproteobacteria bacterium]|nr:site-specific integrase [Gammaproteobacteria bacterium]
MRPESTSLLERTREVLRTHHYALATERAYLYWIRTFIRFHAGRHPRDLDSSAIGKFLTHLAVQRQVSPKTQNQALCALVFLYAGSRARTRGLRRFRRRIGAGDRAAVANWVAHVCRAAAGPSLMDGSIAVVVRPRRQGCGPRAPRDHPPSAGRGDGVERTVSASVQPPATRRRPPLARSRDGVADVEQPHAARCGSTRSFRTGAAWAFAVRWRVSMRRFRGSVLRFATEGGGRLRRGSGPATCPRGSARRWRGVREAAPGRIRRTGCRAGRA